MKFPLIALFVFAVVVVSGCSIIQENISEDCKQKIQIFDNLVKQGRAGKAAFGEIVAKIDNVKERCEKTGQGDVCILDITLKGDAEGGPITVIKSLSDPLGASCSAINECKNYINKTAANYESQNCRCLMAEDGLSYKCACKVYTYSESFREDGNNSYHSGKTQDLNIQINQSSAGKFLRAESRSKQLIPIEITDCK